jgi:hypothetical protein
MLSGHVSPSMSLATDSVTLGYFHSAVDLSQYGTFPLYQALGWAQG